MTSTHTGHLPLPELPISARLLHLFPDLTSASLIAIGPLCDAGCEVTFTSEYVTVTLNTQVIATGNRCTDGLYHIILTPKPTPTPTPEPPKPVATVQQRLRNICMMANFSTLAHRTASDRIAFLHGAAGFPVLATWLHAIRQGLYTTWPGLTPAIVKRHLPKSVITDMGHMNQQRKNQRSTKIKLQKPQRIPALPRAYANLLLSKPVIGLDDDSSPVKHAEDPTGRTNFVFASCQPVSGQVYSDLKGKFMLPSSRGNKYVLIVYDYDSNSILAEPMKNRLGPTIRNAYSKIHALLVDRGLVPRLQRLDNEASGHLQKFLNENDVDWQLAPPNVHRRNAAERAIQTFTNHWVSILSGCDDLCPLHLWCRMLPQVVITLNLLRASRINPQLSAYAQVFGAFDFNRTPMAPLGTKVMIHIPSQTRQKNAPHAVKGWYLGPAMNHYRCYRVFADDTKAERTIDTVSFHPTHTPMPKTSSIDAASAAATDLINALRNPTPASPLAGIDPTKLSALRELAVIFQSSTTPSLPPPTATATTPNVPPTPPTTPIAPPSTIEKLRSIAQQAPSPTISPPRVNKPVPDVPPPRVRNHDTAPSPRVRNHDKTFADCTQNPSQRRRQSARKARDAIIASMPSAAPPPSITAIQHGHHTRFQERRVRSANILRAQLPAHFANAVMDPITGNDQSYRTLLNGPDAATWINGCANEIGRLAQGRAGTDIVGTETIHFIPASALPAGRKATYLRIVVDVKATKAEKHRVRFTVGGNLIDYAGNVSTPTADITTAKLVINSTLSTPGAKFHTFDISNFYLNTPMERYEYMRIPVWAIPECMMQQYKLAGLVENGHVLVEIRKGMYGLPQAGQLAYERLVKHLRPYGYAPARHTPGLWTHVSRPILFSLVVDDFGIKTVGRQHAEHLLGALRDLYSVTVDWSGTKYLGLTLAWDYQLRFCDLSMPGYVEAALLRFQHPHPKRRQDSPQLWIPPDYGATTDWAPLEDTSAPMSPANVLRLQQVVGTFLYYARAVDETMRVALGSLATSHLTGATVAEKALLMFLDYAATHPDATIRYRASDMVLYVHSDASYLSEAKGRSRVGGHFFLSDNPTDPSKPPNAFVAPNGSIHTISSILKNVMSSATESEFAGLFYNARDAVPLRITLIEMGHPQPPTPIQTDNSTANGIANGTVKQRKSKAMDMRFYWIQDRIRQKQFHVYWAPGSQNRADYQTKRHPTSHHRAMRPVFLHSAKQVANNARYQALSAICSQAFPARVC